MSTLHKAVALQSQSCQSFLIAGIDPTDRLTVFLSPHHRHHHEAYGRLCLLLSAAAARIPSVRIVGSVHDASLPMKICMPTEQNTLKCKDDPEDVVD